MGNEEAPAYLTSSQAIWYGLLIIYFPFFPIIIFVGALTLLILSILGLPAYIGLIVGMIVGISCGCLWMAWRIPLWRLWALQHVKDLEDLIPKAVAAGVTSKLGSFNSKMEFKSKEHIAQELALIPERRGARKAYLESQPYPYDYDGDSYCFWARPWTHAPQVLGSFNPQFMFCQVNSERIELERKGEKLSIQLADIIDIKERWGSASHYSSVLHVELTFSHCKTLGRDWPDLNRLSIAPIHPLGHMGYDPECTALFETINAFKSNTLPTIAKNPYQRQLIRDNREDEFVEDEWNPAYPPPAYTYIPQLMDAFRPIFLIIISMSLAFFVVAQIGMRLPKWIVP